jgi:hypothetical protein
MDYKPFKNSITLPKMNSQQLSKLTVLPLNKTLVFYSPIEGRDVLVRTGTLSEGNSFVHAIFHAYSKEYAQMEKKGRMKLVSKFYSKISDKFLTKRWNDASSSIVAQVPFQENISKLFTDFYRFVSKEKDCKTKEGKKIAKSLLRDKKDLETFQIIFEIMSLETLEKKLLPEIYEKCTEQTIENCKQFICDQIRSFVDNTLNKLDKNLEKSKRQFFIDKVILLCNAVTEQAEQIAYKKFCKDLKDISLTIDPFTIGILSEKFNRDIYLIDSRTRMPYIFGNKENIKNRKSIVVMWVGGIHYEIVGKLLPGNRIQRQFEHDDPLIKRVNMFLYKPDIIPEQYPNLIPYLSRDNKPHSRSSSNSQSKEDLRTTKEHTQLRSKSEEHSHSSSKSEEDSQSSSKSHSQSSSKSEEVSHSKSEEESRSSSKSEEESHSSSKSKGELDSSLKLNYKAVYPHRKNPKRRSRHRK